MQKHRKWMRRLRRGRKKKKYILLLLLLAAGCLFGAGAFTILDAPAEAFEELVSGTFKEEEYEPKEEETLDDVLSGLNESEPEESDKEQEELEGMDETEDTEVTSSSQEMESEEYDLPTAYAYRSSPSVDINGGYPFFEESELTTEAYVDLPELDGLGRCGTVTACLGPELLPEEERGEIGHIRPSGWHTVKYPDVIPDRYLYQRCHLAAFCLTGINDDPRNLITGTRYMNVDGMLPYELQVVRYIERTGNHVMYRVTPVFLNDDLVAQGVLIEARSVEDSGSTGLGDDDGIAICAFCYNVQPGIRIDYKTGESRVGD